MFELSKFLLKRLRLWPLATSFSVETASILLYFVNLIIESVILIGTFKYALQHIQDVDEATEPAFASFAFATSMFIYIWMILKRSAISLSIERLEFYVNTRKNINREQVEWNETDDAKSDYEKAEQHYTRVTRRYLFGWMGIVGLYAVLLIISPVRDIIHGRTAAENWVTLFKLAYPVNEHQISVFIIHYTLDFVSVFIHFTIYTTSIAFHMATALYVSALLLDMISMVQKCDIIMKNANLKPSICERDIKNVLKTAINIHVNVLNLTKILVEVMSGVLFIIIANSIIFLAVCLFQMETRIKEGVSLEVYVSSLSATLQIPLIWIFCYYSTLVPMQMAQVGDVVYSINWHLLTKDSQNAIIMLLRQSNKRFRYNGFGIFQCDLETIKMVINSVASYYILLKKI